MAHVIKDLRGVKKVKIISLKSNENLKNIDNFNSLCENLLKKGIDRNSYLIAIGGGTLGDLCGFVASSLMRGLDFKLIPTTLLSQVDSSLGGKNGINSLYGKNLIGTFYHPTEVIIDSEILISLPKREMKSGYAEIVKHALINDSNFFQWLEKNYAKIFKFENKIIDKAILKSINIKLKYIKKDPFERLTNNYSRAMLNFGHSLGHSLETYYKYSNLLNHGEAISIGMIIESLISHKLGYLKEHELIRIINHFKNTKLKIFDKNIKNKKILKILTKDKKNYNNQINIVLLKKIGKSFFARDIEIDNISKIIKNI